jgi:membrane protein insertase Oxa1/YidC/SpoIIIJ
MRVLPLVMIATPLLVAKITPPPDGADPRTTRIMTLVPIVLGIALYRQLSALMLYWVTSNLLQIVQQCWIGDGSLRKIQVKPLVPACGISGFAIPSLILLTSIGRAESSSLKHPKSKQRSKLTN